ncbi:hypothetical protein MS3_00010250 [Schistosoma haematobium]|uniref:Uncharacterized protein n=1 Tax=Schistosoma haematobium TaxID=6185 RepID=A0A922LZY7_SCHHA|nr:hypothetical protein MS3_00010250 [Schistosoma haematobium]KAH9596980.1 hypothetical protein MS3_00010250 [Schistosoma haematobium]
MMRYTFSSGQFILLSSVIVIISTFFDCHEICKNPGLLEYSKLIFGDDSHEYSHYYYYFQTIRRNQPSPVVDENFVKLAAGEEVPLKFPFKFYGTDVSELKMYTYGTIEVKGKNGSGTIYTELQKSEIAEQKIKIDRLEQEKTKPSNNDSWKNKHTNGNDDIQLLLNEESLSPVNINKANTSPTSRKPVDEAIIKAIQRPRK